ncbi:AraC family transcriptional regulator [Paraburkholderia solisilvae]
MSITVVTRGTMLVESESGLREFNAGDAVLLDPSVPCKQVFIEPVDLVVLCFSKNVLQERGLRHQVQGFFAPNMESPDVRAVIDLIVAVAAQKGAPSSQVRRRQGEHFLDVVDLFLCEPQKIRSGGATVFRAKRFIQRNLRNAGLDPTVIAAAAHVSDSHLNRLFTKEEGQSLMRYVLDRRLEMATDALKHGGRNLGKIGEIAHNCGFTTHAHFCRVFKERYGITPKELVLSQADEEAQTSDLEVQAVRHNRSL